MSHIRKKVIMLLVMVITAVTAVANDGIYYTSGNQLVPLRETDISVEKEILTISILDNHLAKVDVYYEFNNPGNTAKSVTMGFEADPSYNDDYKFYASGKHPHIKNFTVEANGQMLSYQNAVCELTDGVINPEFIDLNQYEWNDEFGSLVKKTARDETAGISFAYVYYFTMNFKPGKNIVHHTYQYTMSVTVGTGYEIYYKLSPAARWANKQIDDFTLVIRADNTEKHFVVPCEVFGASQFAVTEGRGKIRNTSHYDTPYYEFSLRNGAVMMHKNNFCPSSEHELVIMAADYLYSFNEQSRCGDYYDRAYSTPLSLSDFRQMGGSKQKIGEAMYKRVIKNLPFAVRGHVFKDATLSKYFSSLWWYMPDSSYKDDTSDFTKTDWEFVKMGK